LKETPSEPGKLCIYEFHYG